MPVRSEHRADFQMPVTVVARDGLTQISGTHSQNVIALGAAGANVRGSAQDFRGYREAMLTAGAFNAVAQIMFGNPTFNCAGWTTDEVGIQRHRSAVWRCVDLNRAGVVRRHVNLVDVHDSVESSDFQHFDDFR